MKRIAGANQPIVGVPVVVEQIEVQNPLLAIPVQVSDVAVTVRVAPTVQSIVSATAL